MTGRGLRRRMVLALVLAPSLALWGCGGGGPENVSFAPLRYNYLPVLKLNVSSISIEDDWQPSDDADHVESLSPETPAAALRQMGEDRLGAYGTSGKAVFVIEDASLVRNGSELDGSFAVRLDVYSADGTRAGFAEARVSQTEPAPGGEGVPFRSALYDLTRHMMNSMNVEFEYQLRRTLGEWLVQGSAAATPIEAQPLPGPGQQSAAPTAPPAPAGPSPATGPQPGVLGTLPLSPPQSTTTP